MSDAPEITFATIDQINAFDGYDHFKFVKVNGQYRFASTSDNWMPNHSDMIKEGEWQLVEGAGTIEVADGRWNFSDRHSMTLAKMDIAKCKVTDAIESELNAMIKHKYSFCF